MVDSNHSARLFFRAPEIPADEDFILSLLKDPVSAGNSSAGIKKPASKTQAKKELEYIDKALLGVIICLPAADETAAPIPIGQIHLRDQPPHMAHHRHSEIGIEIAKAYQGQGFGTEAINWTLKFAFEEAGLHKVNIGCFEYNTEARRLYERLGFKVEGIGREMFRFQGKWWDDYTLGMLDREWEELQAKKDAK